MLEKVGQRNYIQCSGSEPFWNGSGSESSVLYHDFADPDPVPDPYLFLECLESTCVLQTFNVHKNMYYMFKYQQVSVIMLFSFKEST
jgi:hypothetical protein